MLDDVIRKQSDLASELSSSSRYNRGSYYDRDLDLCHQVLGLCSEAGELADAVKKNIFQGHKLDFVNIQEEIGDLLFYILRVCDLLGLEIEECSKANIRKLKKRYPNGWDPERSINRNVEEERKAMLD